MEYAQREICGLMATPCQVAIVEEAKKTETKMLKIDAVAGSSKTTTLCMIAEEIPAKSLYLAFNRTMVEEAKGRFPSHVECRTTHSMAYESIGYKYNHKLNRPKGGYVNVAFTGSEIAKRYGIKPYQFNDDDSLSSAAIGLLVRKCVERFEQQPFEHILDHHVSKALFVEMARKHKKRFNDVKNIVLKYAKKLWRDRIDIDSSVLATHDTYLKLWHLSKPRLNYDVIYLDEAQDTTGCVLDIVMMQSLHAKIIVVGDERQSIYMWRGSLNAISMIDCKQMSLQRSFRYGDEIAKVATAILHDESSSDNVVVLGCEWVDSKVGESCVNEEEQYTVLFRTNAALVEEALSLISNGKLVNIEIDSYGFCRRLESADALFRGDMKRVKHEDVIPYETWESYKEESEFNGEMDRIVKICEQRRTGHVLSILAEHKNCNKPDVVLTTAHKSKGREWKQVILANDFPSHYDSRGRWIGLTVEEQNLLYVAATRAKYRLNINPTLKEIISE